MQCLVLILTRKTLWGVQLLLAIQWFLEFFIYFLVAEPLCQVFFGHAVLPCEKGLSKDAQEFYTFADYMAESMLDSEIYIAWKQWQRVGGNKRCSFSNVSMLSWEFDIQNFSEFAKHFKKMSLNESACIRHHIIPTCTLPPVIQSTLKG